jgi:hypothetical protein
VQITQFVQQKTVVRLQYIQGVVQWLSVSAIVRKLLQLHNSSCNRLRKIVLALTHIRAL